MQCRLRYVYLGIFLYSVCIYVTVIGLIMKLTDLKLGWIRLGGGEPDYEDAGKKKGGMRGVTRRCRGNRR